MLNQISQLIEKAIKKEFNVSVEPKIEYAEAQFGDFSSSVAFELAKQLKKSPLEIAKVLAEAIKSSDIASVEAVGPYVNLKMTDQFWLGQLAQVKSRKSQVKSKGQKVQVEFISANPTGPLTLGNARGGFIGDVIARVLDCQGYDVTREYYFNDAGTQIRHLVSSVKSKVEGWKSPAGEVEIQYKGEYIDELAKEFKAELNSKPDDELGQLLTQEIFKRYIKDAIAKMNIKFDEWFNERELATSGQSKAALERLEALGLVYEAEGATWLKATDLNDERDRVLVKGNGDVTYLGNDIPYHLNIFEKRGFDRAIKVLGADHVGQTPSLKAVINKLLPDKQLEFVILQWVRLVKDGQEVKMSKRAGTYMTVEELIDEVGPDVARWFFLMRSADAQMEFDLGLAKEQSQKNPMWYVMYSYARAHSILKQAEGKGLKPVEPRIMNYELRPEEREIIKQISRFPELLERISQDYGVHQLTFFGQELARLFHDYYESEKIIGLPKAQAEAKLHFIQQYADFINDYFEILGITPQKKM